MSLLLALTVAGGPTAYADNLSVGSYAISGKTVTDLRARNDSLSVGTYVISGQAITDVRSRVDNLSVGAYVISGKDITDVHSTGPVSYADDLSAGAYALAGQSITDLYARNDNLAAGGYVYAGQDITDDVTSVETGIMGGSGWPYLPTGKKSKKRFDDQLAKAMRDIYEGIEEPAILKQAAKIVRPMVQKGIQKTAIPLPESIDWVKLEKDAEKVSALLELWQEQLRFLEEEEIAVLMSIM